MLTEYFKVYEGAVPADMCQLLIDAVDWDNAIRGQSVGDDEYESTRRSDIVWTSGITPISAMSRCIIQESNIHGGWNYDLSDFENTQIGRYLSSEQGRFDWHRDTMSPVFGVQRKLTCSILLNDPSEFEGGEFKIRGFENLDLLTKRGTAIVFPAFLEHCVTPVTKGVRYSAVTWAVGPAFR